VSKRNRKLLLAFASGHERVIWHCFCIIWGIIIFERSRDCW